MDMTPERKAYYIREMNGLADLWQQYADVFNKEQPFKGMATREVEKLCELGQLDEYVERHAPDVLKMKHVYLEKSAQLGEQFGKELGDSEVSWNSLMAESGAEQRMEAITLTMVSPITPKEEQYYLSKMEKLSDLFKAYADSGVENGTVFDNLSEQEFWEAVSSEDFEERFDTELSPDVARAKYAFLKAINDLSNEMDNAGHSEHWFDLLGKSGVYDTMESYAAIGSDVVEKEHNGPR